MGYTEGAGAGWHAREIRGLAEDTKRHKGGAQTRCLQAAHGGAGDPQSAHAQFQEDVEGVQELLMEGEEDRY